MDDTIKYYLEIIQSELEKLKDGRLTGNVEFQLNLKDGFTANMNIRLAKSVKMVRYSHG